MPRTGYSAKARERAALARSIRSLLGEGPYNVFKESGKFDESALKAAREKKSGSKSRASKQAKGVVARKKANTTPKKIRADIPGALEVARFEHDGHTMIVSESPYGDNKYRAHIYDPSGKDVGVLSESLSPDQSGVAEAKRRFPRAVFELSSPSFEQSPGEVMAENLRQTSQGGASLPPPKPPKRNLSELARRLPPLSDSNFLASMAKQRRKPSRDDLRYMAEVQAGESISDDKLIAHYTENGIYNARGSSLDDLKMHQDNWVAGRNVPLWTVPGDTPIALYHDVDATVPDLVGHHLGYTTRQAGFREPTTFARFRDEDGLVYEYPALLGGGSKSPHVRHPSYAAVDPIVNGQKFVPSLGFSFPNFHTGEDAGPSGVPEGTDDLALNIQRAVNMIHATTERGRLPGIGDFIKLRPSSVKEKTWKQALVDLRVGARLEDRSDKSILTELSGAKKPEQLRGVIERFISESSDEDAISNYRRALRRLSL